MTEISFDSYEISEGNFKQKITNMWRLQKKSDVNHFRKLQFKVTFFTHTVVYESNS